MVLAIAALFLQLTPTVEAVPAAAVTAAKAVVDPASLPDAPADVDLKLKHAADESSQPASESSTSAHNAANPESASVSSSPAIPALPSTEALSTIRISDPVTSKPGAFIEAEQYPSRSKWIALSLIQHGAAAFDAYSTRDAISHGATEADPVMKPFANSSAIYAAIQVAPLAFDYTARRMQRSPNNFIRHIWWVPQSVSTASFLLSGAHNLRVAGER